MSLRQSPENPGNPFALDELRRGNTKSLWQVDSFLACAHNGLRVGDLFHNTAPNPNPKRPRLWNSPTYRRTQAVWNYYSP